ncbi:MAG: FG-GAP-like repeat-containing protein [Planctomycetota bacterium]
MQTRTFARCRALVITTCTAALLVAPGFAQAIFNPTSDWRSTDAQVSTGGALADLDRDGWLDFVVANGNDMRQQRLTVFYNRGDGTYPSLPNWQSNDLAYNGHISVADVNGDGWPDVAVAHLGNGTGVPAQPIARVYLNNNGTLGTTAGWTANINGNAFGVAFGDMNNDGRPDLAVASGWAYGNTPVRKYVYANQNGVLAAAPTWTSGDLGYAQGATWVDADNDGWLDLAYSEGKGRSRVYRNTGGTLEATPSWQEGDVASQDGIMVTTGDVTGDGLPEFLMADNNQVGGGSGRFRQYNGLPAGFFETNAAWTYLDGYCSAVALADVNGDGRLDLATGAWWDKTRIFLNQGTGFAATNEWGSTDNTVVEKICFGDIDKDGLRPIVKTYASIPAGRRLFYLPHRPVQKIVSVVADGQPLAPSAYTADHENGWLTIGLDAAALVVEYTASTRLDMATTDWEARGNQVFYNLHLVPGDANCDGRVNFDDINPFVMLLTGSYPQYFPECDGEHACDLNHDGRVTFDDINPFVALLTQ